VWSGQLPANVVANRSSGILAEHGSIVDVRSTIDSSLRNFPRHHPIVGYGGARVVHLQQMRSRQSSCIQFSCLRQSYQEVLIVPVILVLPVRMALEGAQQNALSTFTSRSAALSSRCPLEFAEQCIDWRTQITSCVVTSTRCARWLLHSS